MMLCLGGCGQKEVETTESVAVETVAETKETSKLSDYLKGLADVYVEVGNTKINYLDGLSFDKKKISSIEVDDSKVNTKQAGVYTLRYILSGQRVNGKIAKETVKSKVFVVKKDDAQKLADAGVAVETDKGTKKNSKGEEVVRVVSTQNGSNAVSGGSGSKPSGGSSNTGSNSSTKPSGGSGNNSSSTKPSGGSGSNNSGTKPSGGNNSSTKPSGGSGSSGSSSSTKPSGGGNTGSTKPSGGNGGSSNTKPAETNPPKPAETEPPQTQPPQTNPPQTNPPETEPPQTNPPETEPPQTEPSGYWIHHKDPIYKTICYSICNGCGQDITGVEDSHAYEAALAGNFACGGFWSKYDQVLEGYNEWDEWVEY